MTVMSLKVMSVNLNFFPVVFKQDSKNVLFTNLKPLERDVVSFGQLINISKPKKIINLNEVKVSEVDSGLIDVEKCRVYEGLQQGVSYLDKRIWRFYDLLKQYENTTLDTQGLKLMQDYNVAKYDLPERFAIVANNTIRNEGGRALIGQVPAIFKGLDIDEVSKKLDLLRIFLDKESENVFTIGNKKFKAKFEDEGRWGVVYKIEDKFGNNAAMKIFNDPNRVGPYGSYGETAVFWEASKHNINNIPTFYMANPVCRDVYTNGSKDASKAGGWLLTEFITNKTPLKKGEVDIWQWCIDNNIRNMDIKKENFIGHYFIDLGGMHERKDIFDKYFCMDLSWFVCSYPYIQDVGWYIDTIEKIFKLNCPQNEAAPSTLRVTSIAQL